MLSKYCTLIEESIYVDYIMIISNPKVNRAGFQTSNAVTECVKNVEQLAAVGWIFRSLSLSTVIGDLDDLALQTLPCAHLHILR